MLCVVRICSEHYEGKIKLWNLFTGICEMTFDTDAKSLTAILVIDEQRICTGSSNNTMTVWNVSTGACELTLEGHAKEIIDMALLVDGRLCSASSDGTLKIWNTGTGECESSIQVNENDLYGNIAQLHDGRLVVYGSDNAYIIGG
jgi:WD40 repeat protein